MAAPPPPPMFGMLVASRSDYHRADTTIMGPRSKLMAVRCLNIEALAERSVCTPHRLGWCQNRNCNRCSNTTQL